MKDKPAGQSAPIAGASLRSLRSGAKRRQSPRIVPWALRKRRCVPAFALAFSKGCLVDNLLLKPHVIDVLRRHLRRNRRYGEQPIFIFSCGGKKRMTHPARGILKQYVEKNQGILFRNVFLLRAEDIASEPQMAEFDLLTQEAIVSDIADWLIIFAESVGSFCELGAFAAMPHSAAIASVVVDRKYEGGDSFLLKGAARVIADCGAPFSKVYYSDLNCPLANERFTRKLNDVRTQVKLSEEFPSNKGRKMINRKQSEVLVGSFALEALDLIDILGPLDEQTLVALYCKIKGFTKRGFRLVSRTMRDMRPEDEARVEVGQVLAMMHATNLIGAIPESDEGSVSYYSKVNLDGYFMFRQTDGSDFNDMRARVLTK